MHLEVQDVIIPVGVDFFQRFERLVRFAQLRPGLRGVEL